MSSLSFADVTVSYGKQQVLSGFTANVASGEWLGLIGPNGAGKSSLLRAAVGLVDHGGDISIDGASLTLRSRARKAALLAYVPQAPIMPAWNMAITSVFALRTGCSCWRWVSIHARVVSSPPMSLL